MLKIDVLALGMLTCIRKAFHLLSDWKGEHYALATIPQEDPKVYDMLCIADTLGVFQVESRAQMNFLPRMRPRTFYDLVIEVAVIRPGPIQGDMVHPFIKRRRGEEPVVYPSAALEPVLGKTLGIPLFQEQAMQIAAVLSGQHAAPAQYKSSKTALLLVVSTMDMMRTLPAQSFVSSKGFRAMVFLKVMLLALRFWCMFQAG